MDVRTLAAQINDEAAGYSIGDLQQLRAQLKRLKRAPGSAIFSERTTFDDWAFHNGGRSELQFNIGSEQVSGSEIMRYGVAFSFETSRTLPSIDVLVPKVALFNEYLRSNADLLSGLEMWHFQGGIRSANRAPAPIGGDLVHVGTFVFLGSYAPFESVEPSAALATFDALLPLYQYVEGGNTASPSPSPFAFRAGNSHKKSFSLASPTERALSISLRHNDIQQALYSELCKEFGAANVGTEVSSGTGGRIDAVSRRGESYTFYEIKVGLSIKGLIREAIGQLLEYSMWPGATLPSELVIVGEPQLDSISAEYLRKISKACPVPVCYRRVVARANAAQQIAAADRHPATRSAGG